MAKYLIRLDDIAPNMHWENYLRMKAVFLKLGIKPVLGVIPDNHDPELTRLPAPPVDFWREIREVQSLGWDIAMHGYQHLYVSDSPGILEMSPKSEFAGLPFEVQLQKLRSALAVFDGQGVRVQTFMAPSHTFDQNTLRALASIGITRITDGYWLFPFRYESILMVPQIMERPRALPVGVITFCLHLNSAKESFLREVEQFLEIHRKRFISFDAAVDFERTTMLNRLCGKGMAFVLRWSRTRRRLPAR